MAFLNKFLKKKEDAEDAAGEDDLLDIGLSADLDVGLPADLDLGAAGGLGSLAALADETDPVGGADMDEEDEVGPAPDLTDTKRFRTNTVTINDDSDDEDADVPPAPSPLHAEPAAAQASVATTDLGTDDGEKAEGLGGLMSIFEDEVEVDKTLSTLNSWVEDVEAEELVDELRSLMEDLERL